MVYTERKKKQTARQMERNRLATRRQREYCIDSKHVWAKRDNEMENECEKREHQRALCDCRKKLL